MKIETKAVARALFFLPSLLLLALPGWPAADEGDAEPEKKIGANPVVFWEIASHDAEETAAFLKTVFDWDIDKTDKSPIHYIDDKSDDVHPAAGVFTLTNAKLPFLTIYIQVDDMDEKVRAIEENGGFIVSPPNAITDRYRICLFNEPSGVTLAMIEPTKKEEAEEK
jgi:predicted enzyme related to lactoylglutathione lyase